MGMILPSRATHGEDRKSAGRVLPALDVRRSAALDVRRAAARGEVAQGRLDPAGGEVGAALAHLLDRGELRISDLALLAVDAPGDRGVVRAAVEDQADRVVPAAPRRQPVGEQQVAGGQVERELLVDLAGGGEAGRLADLD